MNTLVLQSLLFTLAGWIQRGQQNVIDYLVEENRVLREQVGKRRVLNDDQRRRLAVRAKAVGRTALNGVASIVTPDTLLRWYRNLIAKKYDGSHRRSPGRPTTHRAIAQLVCTMATDNPGWGYGVLSGAIGSIDGVGSNPNSGSPFGGHASHPRLARDDEMHGDEFFASTATFKDKEDLMLSREIHLVRRPEGELKPDDFKLVQREIAEPGDGQILVQNLYMSVDPALRPRMSVGQELNEAVMGGALGRIIKSRNGAFEEGDIVRSRNGFREAFVSDGKGVARLSADPRLPLTAYMSVLGNPGLTAYGGLTAIAKLQKGETLFVSTAAGAVGSLAVQIGKIYDCYVIGSTGSEEKAAWLRDDLKLDAVINYKATPINKALRASAPKGLEVYFDNVGGDHLDAALAVMNHGGRVAVCGMVSGYNEPGARTVVRNLSNIIYGGITIRGFSGPEYAHLQDEFAARMGEWMKSGKIKYRETVLDGISNAPAAMIGLMHGDNIGKMLVKLA